MSKNDSSGSIAKKTTKCTYSIDGMHCDACKILIKNGIDEYKNITDVKVSLKNNQVTIEAKSLSDIPTVEELNNDFRDAGYSFRKVNNVVKTDNYSFNDYVMAFILFITVAILFAFIERSGFLSSFTVDTSSSFFGFFVFGLVAGVSSCAALVGSIVLTMSKQWESKEVSTKHVSFIMFSIGRLLTFGILGGVLGLVGGLLAISVETAAVISLILAVIIFVAGLNMLGIKMWDKVSLFDIKAVRSIIQPQNITLNRFTPFIIGALTFFVPCGFTLIAQATAINTKSAYTSSMMLLGFALGTLPMLTLIHFFSVKLYSNPKASKVFNMFAGFLTIFFAIYTANAQLNVINFKSLNDLNFFNNRVQAKKATVANDIQVIQIEANAFDYSPKYIELMSGIPTKIEIFNSGAVGCANAVYAKDLYPNVIYLQEGFNETETFIPQKGTYKISCSMGMVSPITVKVF